MDQWYLARGKVKEGPFSRAQLQAAAGAGALRATDMVLQAGTQRWLAAGEVSGLFFAPAAEPVLSIPLAVPAPPAPPTAVLALTAMPPAADPVAPSTAAGLRQRRLWVAAGGIGLVALVVVAVLILSGKSNPPMSNQPLAQNAAPVEGGETPLPKNLEANPVTKPAPMPAAAKKVVFKDIQTSTDPEAAKGPPKSAEPKPNLAKPREEDVVPKQQTSVALKDRPTLVLQLGHTKRVTAVALSPDRKLALTGSEDKSARLWDIASGREIRAFRDNGAVNSVAFSPDGQQMLTGSEAKSAKLWDVASGKVIRDFQPHYAPVRSVAFSPDGKQVLTGSQSGARLWHVASGQQIAYLGQQGTVNSVAFSPDGKQVFTGATSHGDTALLWDVGRRRSIRAFKYATSVTPLGNIHSVDSVAFSPDGKQVLAAVTDGTARLWNKASGKEIRTFDPSGADRHKLRTPGLTVAPGSFSPHSKPVGSVLSLAFSPDGKQMLSGASQTRLWDAADGTEIHTFTGQAWSVAVFSRDGKYVLMGNADGTARLWDAASKKELRTFRGLAGTVSSVAFSPDGKRLLTGSTDKTARLWDAASGKPTHIFGHADVVTSVALSADGKLLLTGSGTPTFYNPTQGYARRGENNIAALWDAASGKKIRALTHSNQVTAVAFSPDGKQVLTGSKGGHKVLWDATSGKPIHTLRYEKPTFLDANPNRPSGGPVSSVAFSSDGKHMLTGVNATGNISISADGGRGAQLWDAASGQAIRGFWPSSNVRSVAFSPDGTQVLTADQHNIIRLWDAASGKLIRDFKAAASAPSPNPRTPPQLIDSDLQSVAFSPDGKQVLAADGADTLRLWDAASAREIQAFQGHTDRVASVAFSPDGKRLLTGGADGTARLWDTASGRELCRLLGLRDGTWAVVTPDNYYMASKGALEGVAFRVGKQVFPFDQFDLKFNRPDKVLEGVGLASQAMVTAYRHAHQKRLKRMNFTEEMLGDDFHIPEIAVKSAVTFTTRENTLKLKVQASDSKYLLDRLHIYVNGVPIGDSGGIDLRKQRVKTWQQEIEIELSSGKNKIDVSVLNEKGAESLKETLAIDCEAPKVKPDLYVVAVGVSDYVDSRYRLTYAHKDAGDLADLFESKRDRFGQVKVLRILEREATRENILKARDLLNKSQVDDQVVLFFAGHGLLDSKLDYYFATADIDFKKPAERGLPYEAVEGLLDGIKARKRLVLMDTCHSGELDKEDVKVVQSEKLPEGEVKARSFRGLELEAPRLGLRNSYQLLQEMFADLRRGTGAVVIASAGGAEYALESEAWKNGVFTYAVLRGLKGQADRNKDGRVRVSELRDFVQEEVRRLTHGRQAPTARRDNLEVDFTVD